MSLLASQNTETFDFRDHKISVTYKIATAEEWETLPHNNNTEAVKSFVTKVSCETIPELAQEECPGEALAKLPGGFMLCIAVANAIVRGAIVTAEEKN